MEKMEKKNNKPKDSTPNRLNVLYILLVLKKHSSEDKPLSIDEITKHINEAYYKTYYHASISNTTVSRTLDSIFDDSSLGFQKDPMDYDGAQTELDFHLHCVTKAANGEWKPYVSKESDESENESNEQETALSSENGNVRKKHKKHKPHVSKWYYYESTFSDAELITLIDSIETYNYFSTDDIAGLVSKLLKIRPQSKLLHSYYKGDGKRLKDENSLVLMNIDDFSRIIESNQFANITYCNYDYKGNLVPRDGYPRIIRPLSMMWSNGYYYLIALLKPGYTPANLRMDRITEIEAVLPTPQMLQDFQVDVDLEVSDYRMHHPIMHGGKVTPTTMLYLDSKQNNMNNAIIDTFGKIVHIRPATAEELKNHLSPRVLADSSAGTWMRADFRATTAGTELFATQYCRYCKVVSPQSLSQKIADNLKSGLQLY